MDENIVDPARVMRMPFSFNCKEFDPTNKYHSDTPKAIPTRLVRETDKRYSVQEIFEKLEMLPDSPASFNMQVENPQLGKQEEICAQNTTRDIEAIKEKLLEMGRRYTSGEYNIPKTNDNSEQYSKDKEEKYKYELDNNQIEEMQDIYKMINIKKLPSAVQKMLYCTRKGFRGRVLYFLVTFLSNKEGMPLDKVLAIMKIWATRCSPSLDVDYVLSNVERIYRGRYKGDGKYDSEMAKEFGYIEFSPLQTRQ
ncbi:MAG TPA: hypothetical protein GXX35_15400 [Thermoanaerobacterales bacterium]|nr:hypothetical protein [Thermoanaerobacterales bacterium]